MKKTLIFHPWLFALVPILGLFEHNQDIASAYYLPKPILISLVASTALFFIFNTWLKDKTKSAIITSIIIVSFFVFDLLAILFLEINSVLPLGVIFYDVLSLLIYIIILGGIIILIAKGSTPSNKLTAWLNLFALIVLIIQLSSIANYQYKNQHNSLNDLQLTNQPVSAVNTDTSTTTPDIYYIILDAYGRSDILNDIYGYDNSQFINFLKNKGFYVAEKSRSNYNQTFLSMASSLNLNYLDEIAAKVPPDSDDRSILKKLLKNNFIYQYLKDRGYSFTAFPSQWDGIYKNTQADINLAANLKQNSFDAMLIKKTPLALFLPALQIKDLAIYTNNVLDKIPSITEIKEPTFSYIHILAPHPPFIFKSDGTVASDIMGCMEGTDGSHYFESCPGISQYQKKYIEQLNYINQRFETIISTILEKSPTPPIIVLQADHGPGSMLDWENIDNTNLKERFSILNAYYLPNNQSDIFYPEISPINSFRIIFNKLFGDNWPLLEDRSFFATWNTPYQFTDVSELLD